MGSNFQLPNSVLVCVCMCVADVETVETEVKRADRSPKKDISHRRVTFQNYYLTPQKKNNNNKKNNVQQQSTHLAEWHGYCSTGNRLCNLIYVIKEFNNKFFFSLSSFH